MQTSYYAPKQALHYRRFRTDSAGKGHSPRTPPARPLGPEAPWAWSGGAPRCARAKMTRFLRSGPPRSPGERVERAVEQPRDYRSQPARAPPRHHDIRRGPRRGDRRVPLAARPTRRRRAPSTVRRSPSSRTSSATRRSPARASRASSSRLASRVDMEPPRRDRQVFRARRAMRTVEGGPGRGARPRRSAETQRTVSSCDDPLGCARVGGRREDREDGEASHIDRRGSTGARVADPDHASATEIDDLALCARRCRAHREHAACDRCDENSTLEHLRLLHSCLIGPRRPIGGPAVGTIARVATAAVDTSLRVREG